MSTMTDSPVLHPGEAPPPAPPPQMPGAITRTPLPHSTDNGVYPEKPAIAGQLSLAQRFDRVFPPYKRYFNHSRRTFLLALCALITLLVLILALGLGLGLKHSHKTALPLPSNRAIFTGDLTYYAPALGACGITSSSSQSICAVSHLVFDAVSTGSNPNANPLCGKKIRVTRYEAQKGGNSSVDVTVVDRCVGCKAMDLDLSLSAFETVAEEVDGRVTGSWAWLD